MIKSLCLIAVVLGAVPFLLGLYYTLLTGKEQKDKEADNVLLHMAAGYVIMFALFEIMALPLIFLRQPLSLLVKIYGGTIGVLSAVSFLLHVRRFPKLVSETFAAVKRFTFCIWAQFLILAGQVLVYIRYQYQNTDDAFFVASATTSIATDTIFAYSPYTGTLYETLPSRYVLSPFYAFTAVIAKLTDTHPAILAHSVFMIVFLLWAYAVYALIGRALFQYDMEKTGYFLLLLSGLHLFAAYSERTSGLFLLIRLWQGKAILAGILLPMLLYMAIRMFWEKQDCGVRQKASDWLLVSALMCACCMVSSMGIMLGAIMLGLLGILAAWRHKSLRILVLAAVCCLPNLFCAGIYLVIR